MSHLVAHDRQKYEDLAAVPQYQDYSPGEHHAPVFCALVGDHRGTVLDAGCATGKGGLALARSGFTVTLCDYTDGLLVDAAKSLPFRAVRTLWDTAELHGIAKGHGHWNRRTFDYVYCCDVLEHIPREFTMLTVQALLSVTQRGAFFSIGLTPDAFGVWVGRPLHETVESFVWWRDRFKEFGTLIDARDLAHTGIYFVRPR